MLQVSFFLASGSVSSLLPHHSNFQAYPNFHVKQPLSKTWGSFNKLLHKEGARWRQLSWAVVSLLGQTSQEVIFLDIEMTLLLPNPRNPNWFSDLLCQLIRFYFFFLLHDGWLFPGRMQKNIPWETCFFAKKHWKPNCYPHRIQRAQHGFQALQTAMRGTLYWDKVLPEAQK